VTTGSGHLGLGDLLKTYRRRAMVSQEELAQRAGVSTRTVSNIERGAQVSPRHVTLGQLSVALGLTPLESERLIAAAANRSAPAEDTPALTAARSARHANAWQLAVAEYERHLAPLVADTDPSATSSEQLLELGDAATQALLRHEARPAYLRAALLALSGNDRASLLHAAEGYAFMTKHGDAGIGAERLWHRALLATPLGDHEARALLGAARATALHLDGVADAARRAADQALDMAERSGLGGAVAVAAAARCVAGWGDPNPGHRLALARLVADAGPLRVPTTGLEGLELEAVPRLQLGHFAEFRELVAAFEDAADNAPTHSVSAQAHQWRAAALLLDGRPTDAVEAAASAMHTAGSPPNFTSGFEAQVFCALRMEGRVGELVDVLRTRASDVPVEPAWVAGLAVALTGTEIGTDDRAREIHRLVDRIVDELWPLAEGFTKLVSLAFLAETAAVSARPDLAAVVEEALIPYEGQFVVVATGTSCEGSVERYLACTAWARGDRALADCRFDAATQAEATAGAPTLICATEALRERLARAPGHRRRDRHDDMQHQLG
jgi:transcriptional regulator with XRE-family HTH domain